jgi:hypothetical protein
VGLAVLVLRAARSSRLAVGRGSVSAR